MREPTYGHVPTGSVPTTFLKSAKRDLASPFSRTFKKLLRELTALLGEPYFAEQGFVLYNKDCEGVLSRLAGSDLRARLTLTSPPYNIGKEYESALPVPAYVNWCSGWMQALYRVAADNGAFWLNLGYLEVPGRGLCVPIPYLLWDKSEFYLLQEVVWTYGAGVSTRKRLSPRNEKWLYYVKDPEDYIFNLDSIRDPNVKYPNQKRKGKYRCNPLGKNPSDVWEFPKVTTGKDRKSRERTSHPAQFPLRVVERIVLSSSNPGDLVLDPFAGSCSAGIAAVAHNRFFLGIEKRLDYCKEAVMRFEQFLEERRISSQQPGLFQEE